MDHANLQIWIQVIPLIVQDQFNTIQNLQRSPIPQTRSGTFFCCFLQQIGSSVQWWIVTVFVTWERSQRKIQKFLLPILTNRWSALASIGLYRKPQKQRGSMGTECCFCCIYFWMRKPMMNWHLPQLQRNYFWAKSCRAFVQLWHWILVTTGCYGGCECSIVMHCNGEELGHLNLVFLKSYITSD